MVLVSKAKDRVDTFYIDKYEVSVELYKKYLESQTSEKPPVEREEAQ